LRPTRSQAGRRSSPALRRPPLRCPRSRRPVRLRHRRSRPVIAPRANRAARRPRAVGFQVRPVSKIAPTIRQGSRASIAQSRTATPSRGACSERSATVPSRPAREPARTQRCVKATAPTATSSVVVAALRRWLRRTPSRSCASIFASPSAATTRRAPSGPVVAS
jgi:hypothetical protein